MKEFVSEFIGTFLLIFFGTGAIAVSTIAPELNDLAIALIVGGTIALVIETFGDISGAHINPAVTIGFWLAKRCDGKRVLSYIIAQLLGSILASVLLYYLFQSIKPDLGLTQPFETNGAVNIWICFIIEYLLTLILMYVILQMATGSKEKGLKAGTIVGLTVFIEVLVFGPITGGSMNPARSIAPAVVLGDLSYLWIYVIAPVLGAISSVPLYNFMRKSK